MMKIRYASVCSGVEAASLAWEYLGWEPVWFSEIDPFPCAVLKERFPTIPNLGDMTKIKCTDSEKGIFEYGDANTDGTFPRIECGRIDLLVGGTPCQSFSMAGNRTGLRGLSGLALTYCDLLAAMRPNWFVWENVPGVFSTNRGEDFRAILAKFDACGYSCAWRVLDAQYVRTHGYPTAVPQRRRRVFVVGHIGADWRCAAEVLFERNSLFGNPPPRRIKGQATAAGTQRSTATASTITDRAGKPGGGKGPLVSDEVSLTLNTQNNQALVSVHGAQTPITSEGFAHPLGAKNCGLENCFVQKIYSIDSAESNSMKSANPNSGVHEADVARTLDTTDPNPTKRQGGQMVMQVINDQGGKCINLEKQEVPPTIRREMKHHEPLIAYPINSMVLGKDLKAGDRQTVGIGEEGEPLPTLQAAHHHAVAMTSCVRRIMPIECERLMGFPDNWTRIPWRGKPEEECPSNPRFKACGNSMTVPQMRWIGIGIDEVERIMRNAQAIETKKENTK